MIEQTLDIVWFLAVVFCQVLYFSLTRSEACFYSLLKRFSLLLVDILTSHCGVLALWHLCCYPSLFTLYLYCAFSTFWVYTAPSIFCVPSLSPHTTVMRVQNNGMKMAHVYIPLMQPFYQTLVCRC